MKVVNATYEIPGTEKKIHTHRVVILTRLGEALKEEAVRGTEVAEQLLTDSS
jgi:hypothetical protein